MPAPLAKGIIISLSILAAIGIAVYENPQVKDWVDDQRRKIAEFLNSFGDELDPQSRREAEAFAYEGRIPMQRRESAGSASAVARATGREVPTDDAVSRRNRPSIVQTPSEEQAAERRRLGREFLAKRNQEMLDIREKQKMRKGMVSGTSSPDEKIPPSPTFDNLVNADGTLKLGEQEADGESLNEKEECVDDKPLELPSVPTDEPKSFVRKIPIQEPAETSAFQTGSRYANPFGDEFEVSTSFDSRSATPKPPVPPKIALEETRNVRRLSIPLKEPSVRQIPIMDNDEPVPANLSFDEQLVRALSLSLAESEAAARLARDKQEQEDPAYLAAVAASIAETERQKEDEDQQTDQLISLAPDPPLSVPAEPSPTSEHDDELYTLSPDFALRHPVPIPITRPMIIPPPYDPVHEAAASQSSTQTAAQTPPAVSSPTTATLSPEFERDAISFAPSESDDDFASVASRTHTSSEGSLIDFAEVESVSDDESEPSGVLTPGSWTDVGSDVDSEEGNRVAH